MEFDLRALRPDAVYRLMASTITPRPIAWVTTQSRAGAINAAPFSFFNMMGAAPPTIVLGLTHRPDGGLKDSAANILDTGEFVVNLVSYAHAERMNLTSIDAPANVDELALAGLDSAPSTAIAPPRIAAAPASFECTLAQSVARGGMTIVLADVLVAHVADQFVLDPARPHVDAPGMDLIGRLHGAGWYARQNERFQLDRPSYADWIESSGGASGGGTG